MPSKQKLFYFYAINCCEKPHVQSSLVSKCCYGVMVVAVSPVAWYWSLSQLNSNVKSHAMPIMFMRMSCSIEKV